MDRFDLIVAGGGASALFVLLQAARQAPDWRLAQIAPCVDFGPAYATSCERHLLNVPADRMGATPDAPDGFERWLDGRGLARSPEGPFRARRLYREYLEDLHRGLAVRVHVGEASEVRAAQDGTWRIACASARGSSWLEGSRLIVATGPAPRPPLAAADPRVVEAWSWWNGLEPGWRAPDSWRRIALLGSGLTAMDVAVGLRARGFTGRIDVYSRAGRWAEAHAPATSLDPATARALIESLRASRSARQLIRVLRRAAHDSPWRAVVDALRPYTNPLWRDLPAAERRRLLRHAFGLWNRHRHRGPPETAAQVASDRDLVLHAARATRGADGRLAVDAELIVDCTGLGLARAPVPSPLIASLLAGGHLRPAEGGLGWQNATPERLGLMGALRFGEEFECTAVPELRRQAADLVAAWREGSRVGPAGRIAGA